MSFEACYGEVRDASGRNLPGPEIERLFEEVQRRAENLRRDRPSLAAAELSRIAAEQLSQEARMAAAIEARNAKINLTKRLGRHERMAQAADPSIVLEASMGGTNTSFTGSRRSVFATTRALEKNLIGGLGDRLQKAGAFNLVAGGQDDRALARELFELNTEGGRPGASGNALAAEAAKIINGFMELTRNRLNREGAWIGKYDGYITRTAHDPDKIAKAGFQAWRRDIEPRLAERTFEGVDDREPFLRRIYNSLVTGVHFSPEGTIKGLDKDPAFKGPGSLAKRMSQSRVLHFKDAEAWYGYQEGFGQPRLVHSIVGQLRNAARDISLMQRFGTNPRAEFDQDIAWIKAQRDKNPDMVRNFGGLRESLLRAQFNVLDGTAERPASRTLSKISSGARAWIAMSRLGGAMLSAVSDVALKGVALKRNGVGLLEAYADSMTSLVRGTKGAELKEVYEALDAYGDGLMGDLSSHFDAADGVTGHLAAFQSHFFRLTGLTYWTDAQRAGASAVLARHLGGQRANAWEALSDATRRSLDEAGFTPAEWEAMRRSKAHEVDGKTYLTPKAAEELNDDAIGSLIQPQLQEMRIGRLEAISRDVAGLDRLKERLAKLDDLLAQERPDPRAPERAELAGTVAAYDRQLEATSALTDAIVAMRDGEKSTNQTLSKLRSNLDRLAKDERAIGERTITRIRKEAGKLTRDTARRAEAEAAVTRIEAEIADRMGRLDRAAEDWQAAEIRMIEDARIDLTAKFQTFFADNADQAVLQPGLRARAAVTGGTAPGTILGTVIRHVMQFKSFPIAVVDQVLARELRGGADVPTKLGAIAHIAVGTTVLGYIAMAAKDISKGKIPRPPTDPSTWAAAFVQGGGAGIMGDFLFGQTNRYGGGLIATAAGPSAGVLEDLHNLWGRVREGDDVAASSLRLALANTPFLNVWYARAGLDYAVINQMQEALNPGYLRRMERRVKQETGQEYFLRPTDALGVK